MAEGAWGRERSASCPLGLALRCRLCTLLLLHPPPQPAARSQKNSGVSMTLLSRLTALRCRNTWPMSRAICLLVMLTLPVVARFSGRCAVLRTMAWRGDGAVCNKERG